MSATRRQFLASAAALAATPRLLAQAATAADPLRPRYHLMPAHAWMNDPNGPIYWAGKYHLFFQVNARGGADWGDISWAHAVSPDMVHWTLLANVLEPAGTGSAVAAGPGDPDSYGVFSGSAIADGDRALFFYTAVSKSPEDLKTISDPGTSLREQQVVAISRGDLTTFTRQHKPLLPSPPAELQPIAGFRDPTVWREGSVWWMAVGSGTKDKAGVVLLYKATKPTGDDADWTYVGPLYTAPGNGKQTPDTVGAGTMFECPDFFALDGHHVLLYSTEGKVYWLTGTLDKATMRFTPGKRGLLDSGAFYAPKSFEGPHGERVLWGWIPERRPKEEYIAAGWSGVMSLPRVLHVDADGNLTMRVAPQVEQLAGRMKPIGSGATVPGLQTKIEAKLHDGGALTLRMGEIDALKITCQGNTLHVEDRAIELSRPDATLILYVDASVIEIFVGDLAAHTARVYPRLTPGASLRVTLTSGEGRMAIMQAAEPRVAVASKR
ncbi:beta-fructofuranosidase [Bryocella elongata]|uniref:beta-fructofuranosidase n=1 Tax=Bryocella elongata TaxID=863522 RepID=A0A1H6AA38_9BACT|nr:glycoside hydrolase family 32 protein [Bryocella elongata]SEG44925.1 beta-fructofuranosidase [Bryocella elongata]